MLTCRVARARRCGGPRPLSWAARSSSPTCATPTRVGARAGHKRTHARTGAGRDAPELTRNTKPPLSCRAGVAMYESDDIIEYLFKTYGGGTPVPQVRVTWLWLRWQLWSAQTDTTASLLRATVQVLRLGTFTTITAGLGLAARCAEEGRATRLWATKRGWCWRVITLCALRVMLCQAGQGRQGQAFQAARRAAHAVRLRRLALCQGKRGRGGRIPPATTGHAAVHVRGART